MSTPTTRISFRDTDGTDTYVCTINPDTYDPVDSVDYQLIETLDGSPARITTTFDSRVRTMKWPAYPVSNTTFTALVAALKAYKGLEKQIYLGDIDSAYSFGWRNIKVIDVRTELEKGGDLRMTLQLDYVYVSSY